MTQVCVTSPLFPVNEASSLVPSQHVPPSDTNSLVLTTFLGEAQLHLLDLRSTSLTTAKFVHYHGDKSMKLVCRAILFLRSQWLAVALVNVASSA